MTRFYGWPDAQQKFKSWKLLAYLKNFVDGPWLCVGDFNAILNTSEKLSIRQPQSSQINEFREALDFCQLEDLGYRGYPFTWTNKRPRDANTKMRLDRAVASKGWREKFHMSIVVHLPPYASDHLPIIVQVQTFSHKQRRFNWCFKFEENWLLWDDCEEVIQGAWNMAECRETGLAAIKKKISACGVDLKAWGATKAEPKVEAIKQLQNRLDSLNKVDYTDASQAEYLEVSKRLDDLLLKWGIY